MKKHIFILFLCLVFSGISQAGISGLQNFMRLHEHLGGELKIKEGNYVGRGVTTDKQYQLTLVQYSSEAPEQFNIILERLTSDHKIEEVEVYASRPVSDTQQDFSQFVLNLDKTVIVPPYDGTALMTLTLSYLEKGRMMLELKPLNNAGVFTEIVRFYWGRSLQSEFSHATPTRYSSQKNEFRVWEDNEGKWAEVILVNDAEGSGTFLLSNGGMPGLYHLKKVERVGYGREVSDQVSYVVYFSRRVLKRGLITGPFFMGKTSRKYVTTIPSLSIRAWEMERD